MIREAQVEAQIDNECQVEARIEARVEAQLEAQSQDVSFLKLTILLSHTQTTTLSIRLQNLHIKKALKQKEHFWSKYVYARIS